MKGSDFYKLMRDTFAAIEGLSRTKGAEYADERDQLSHFKESGAEAGVTPEQAWLIFFNKHDRAVKSFVRNGMVHSEPIEGRIHDAILYLVLLKAMIVERDTSEFIIKDNIIFHTKGDA